MKREIKTILIGGISGFLMVVTIGFAEVKNTSKLVNDVVIDIVDQQGNFFTDRQEVLSLLNADNTDYVLGLSVGELDLKELERRVETHSFIRDAQVYRDIRGNLVVIVQQSQPVARLFDPDGADYYIDREGRLLPTTTKHTARVPLIHLERKFTWKNNITETAYGEQVLEMLKYVEGDEFWRAQIAGIIIARDGELTLLPQITKQEVKFGMPTELDDKFRKLKVFYKEILPNKGWNTYSVVNLKFKNQIICE